jgi:quercetin dioxygenase-like cupin family protein
MTLDEFRRDAAAGGFADPVDVTRDPDCVMGDHEHPFDAFALITQGDITLEVAGVQTRYGVGDFFRLPAGTRHAERTGPQGVHYLAARREPRP